MKILFVTYDFPYPLNSGGKNRAYHLIKYAAYKYDVFLFSFVRDSFRKEYIENLKEIGVKEIYTFKRKKVLAIKNLFSSFSSSSIFKNLYFDQSVNKELLTFIAENNIDYLHFESFYTGFYVSESIKNLGVKQVFGTENIEYILYKDYVSSRVPSTLRFLFNRTLKNIKKEEEYMLKNSDINIAVTEEEKKQIQTTSDNPCFVIPNGVDLSVFKFHKRKLKRKNLLFVGDFSYFPNVDAIDYFYHKILPILDDSDIRLTVVGKNVSRLSFLSGSQIKTHSYVEDIIEMYNSADIFVSPVRIGGGTNFKIIEAMATGLPVVSDQVRTDALGVRDGSEILLAQTPEEFKEAIYKLFKNESLYNKMADNAYEFVKKNYSWDLIGKKLLEVYS